MITRNLVLRERLPERAQAAGYSIMYVVQGVGYRATALLSAAVMRAASPAAAVLAGGVGIMVVITAVSGFAELRASQGRAVTSVG